jgi:hypothetical protein
MNKAKNELKLLLEIIDQAYEKQAWHGPNLKGSLRGLTARQASWRPARGRHNIWELVIHATYWKYAVQRRLVGGKRGSFPLKGSNWFKNIGKNGKRAWKEDLGLLDETHRGLRETIAMLAPSRLRSSQPGSKVKNITLIYGIASHDLYHAGQIQLLKRLQGKRSS